MKEYKAVASHLLMMQAVVIILLVDHWVNEL